jgi:hypothetical protein
VGLVIMPASPSSAQAEEARARPPGAGHGKRDLGQAAIGGTALVQDHDALGPAVPLPHQDGSGLEAMTLVPLCREFVSIADWAGLQTRNSFKPFLSGTLQPSRGSPQVASNAGDRRPSVARSKRV